MNCKQFELRLDDYLDHELFPGEAIDADAHLKQCSACQTRVERARALQHMLKEIPTPPLRSGFTREAIARATGSDGKKHQRRGFVAGFSTAIAASVALMAVITLLPHSLPEQLAPVEIAQVAISLEQTQTVNLVFNTAQALDGATLTIALPANVEVPGLPGQRTITWQTNLQAGKNILPLPLKGLRRDEGELLASIEQDGKIKSVRVHISVGKTLHPQARLRPLHSA